MIPRKMSLTFSTNAKELIVNGGTFYIKEMLKLHGAKWNGSTWVLSIDLDSQGLRNELQDAATKRRDAELADDRAARAYAKSPEGIAAKAAADLEYAHQRRWTCCEKCYVMDIDRGHVGCHEHGFFVKGRLHTGD